MRNRKNTYVKCKFNKNLYNNMNNADDYIYQHCYSYNNYLSKQEFKERGVTIMSLDITIIVLLILSGITIKLALDDNGIIKQSKLASEQYQNKALQEQFALNQAEQEIEKASNSSSSSGSSGGGNQSSGGGSTSGGTTGGSSENVDELKRQIDELQAQVAALEANQATGNATASQVLSGATFSTSEGVGLTGTMVNHSAITTAISIGTDESKVYLRTSPGAYLTNSTSGYPEICANISDINNATGYKYTKEQYDANYSTGYNEGKNGKATIVNLGKGQSFDVSDVCSKNGIDPTKLSTDNFLITLASEFKGGAPSKRESGGTVYNVNTTSVTATYSSPVLTAKFVNNATSYGDHCSTSSKVVYGDVIAYLIIYN